MGACSFFLLYKFSDVLKRTMTTWRMYFTIVYGWLTIPHFLISLGYTLNEFSVNFIEMFYMSINSSLYFVHSEQPNEILDDF